MGPAAGSMTRRTSHAESLTVQQMAAFCRVYECGGYAGAAEVLGFAVPTIWEQVKTLERIYAAKLFARSGRNITPTDRGHCLYEMLRPLLAGLESTFDRLEETVDTASEISLVTGARMMMEELGAPLRLFQKSVPQARLRLMTADNVTGQQMVLDGDADLALLIEPPPDMLARGIELETLYPVEYLVVLPPRHRLLCATAIRLADLMDERLIVGNSHTIGRMLLEQARFRLGMKKPLHIVAETDSSAITIACVRAGMGIGIIAGRPAGHLTRHVKTMSIADEVGQVQVVAAYREGRQLTDTIQRLLTLIRSHVA